MAPLNLLDTNWRSVKNMFGIDVELGVVFLDFLNVRYCVEYDADGE